VDHFEPEADDTEHQPGQSRLIGQLDAESSRILPDGDFAVVEFCAHCVARLAGKSDLIRV
jgi:hypothetical protein